MSSIRSIKNIFTSEKVQLGNHIIQQAIPVRGLQQFSPFILLHHFDFTFEPGDDSFHVPPHPHRGFSPITFMFEGSVEHKDSLGNEAVIYDNEVQWINAGRGIIHSEKASKEMIENGGRYQGIQLWINTVARDKMLPATYQPIVKEDIVLIEDTGVTFRLVSGAYLGLKGPAKSDVLTAMLRMDEGAFFELNLTSTNHSAIYLLEGEVTINQDKHSSRFELITFENTEGSIYITANSAAKILVLSGEPIDEPLFSHGPFVMNSETEILEAMRDYNQGKMGFLP